MADKPFSAKSCSYMICKRIVCKYLLNESELICSYTVKWFQVFLSNTNNSILYQLFVYTQLNGYKILLVSLFNGISIITGYLMPKPLWHGNSLLKWLQVFLSNISNSIYQVFLYNIDNLYTAIWFQITIIILRKWIEQFCLTHR